MPYQLLDFGCTDNLQRVVLTEGTGQLQGMEHVRIHHAAVGLHAVTGGELHTVRDGQPVLHRFQFISLVQRCRTLVELGTQRGYIAVLHLLQVIPALDEVVPVCFQRTLQTVDLRIGLFGSVRTHRHFVQERVDVFEDAGLVIEA